MGLQVLAACIIILISVLKTLGKFKIRLLCHQAVNFPCHTVITPPVTFCQPNQEFQKLLLCCSPRSSHLSFSLRIQSCFFSNICVSISNICQAFWNKLILKMWISLTLIWDDCSVLTLQLKLLLRSKYDMGFYLNPDECHSLILWPISMLCCSCI